MGHRRALLLTITPVLFLASSAVGNLTKDSPCAAAPRAPAHKDDEYMQVRAEYIDLYGNRDETNTTLTLVNRSMSKTLVLGDVLALGPNGANEVLAIDAALEGVSIPPLGSLDLPVDSTHFPGLQPKIDVDSRSLESVVVSWSGPKDGLRLIAAIHLEQPGNNDNRVVNLVEGERVLK